jgi:uncharacterized protein (TIGR03086 family)
VRNVPEMLGRALDGFGRRVRAVGEGQWTLVAPCDEWTVRDLVNHVVWLQRWTPLLIGRPNPADAGKSFDGDLLGDDSVDTWAEAQGATREAVRQADPEQKMSTPYGEMPVSEFLAEYGGNLHPYLRSGPQYRRQRNSRSRIGTGSRRSLP